MSECLNLDVQDLLPEFAAGLLPASDRVMVEVHLSSCPACAEDVRLLEAVRRTRPVVPHIDVAAIVAALPTPPSAVREVPTLRVVSGNPAAPPPSIVRPSRRQDAPAAASSRATRSWFRGAGLRVAAMLTVVALGGLSLEIARRGQSAISDPAGSVVLSDAPMIVADGSDLDTPRPYADDVTPIVPVVAVAPSVLPVQELSEYTDEELALLLARLEAWDGAPTVEPDAGVVPPSNDSSRGDSTRGTGESNETSAGVAR
ncbi:MAG: zf-HC2 domain-containing protein [Gemmatimonadaceae bacterium]|jgi:hypothetical protein|nr:zf-HC2 domain-containing protein [Gemmatimonadaceae bacterium]